MPTSRLVDSPGASLPLSCPSASTRSWTSSSSVFFRSMINRLPAGTSTLAGVKRISLASTLTRVVSPVAATPAEVDEALIAVVALGSRATPPATANSTAATPAAARPRLFRFSCFCWAARSSFVARTCAFRLPVTGSGGFFFARREALIPRKIRGRNAASPSATSPEHSTRTQLGTGSRQIASPRLMIVIRSAPKRANSVLVARTAAGPPPRTTGRR